MPVNDFLPYANDPAANIIDQTTWAAGNLSQGQTRAVGFLGSTVAESQEANKIWKQSSFVAAAIAQFIFEQLNVDVLDNGNLESFVALLRSAGRSLQPRQQIPAGVQQNYYVSNSGSDGNDGLTSATAWQTIQQAANFLLAHVDFNGQQVIVNIAPGTYAPFSQNGNPIGCFGPTNLIYQGMLSNPAAVVIHSGNVGVACAVMSSGAQATLQGMVFTSNGDVNSNAVLALAGSNVFINAVIFGSCTGAHLVSNSGSIASASGNYTVAGNATAHLAATGNGVIESQPRYALPPVVVTMQGNPAFSIGFAFAAAGASISITPSVHSFSGVATGPHYVANLCGTIDVNGGGQTFFPGSVAGTADATTYGVYVP
jgi:hypothetical protein